MAASEVLTLRVPLGTLARLDRARQANEDRADVARAGVEGELQRRELIAKTSHLENWIAPPSRPRDFGVG
jgi:hypothetical protein